MLKAQSIIVIDDFYNDPLEIRSHALSLDYTRKDGETYPDKEAISDRDWEPIKKS